MKDPKEYNVRAVERAIKILECFDDDNPERGVTEIAEIVDLHKATTHRIVTTLLNYGYLERSDGDQRYRLGLHLAGLGFKVIRRMSLRHEALPYLKELVEMWDETCDLCIYDQERVFYIEVLRGNHALTIAADVGQRLPVHCTASGKLFLAYLPEKEVDVILRKPLQAYTQNTITSPHELRKQLKTIKMQGYSIDNEELEEGVRAIAVPIRDHTNRIIAAVSIPGPVNRMSMDRISEMSTSFIRTAEAISHRMGWKV